MSGKVRIHNLSVSLDGFATGEDQTLEAPMGHSGHSHLAWIFGTRFATAMMGGEGGANSVDDAFAQQWGPGIGAEIMGAYKFGPPGWQDDPDWKGWWGPNPPFHTPTFVLTHKPKPSIEMEGGTTFHFLDATPAKALEVALEAALGQDVRIGGGPTVAREFIAAGLVDHIHIVQAPVLFGRGVRLWDGLEGMEKDYDIEAVTSPSGVTHFFLERLPLGASTGGGEEEDAPRTPYHAARAQGDTE
jgi:dihydrofolate reductase